MDLTGVAKPEGGRDMGAEPASEVEPQGASDETTECTPVEQWVRSILGALLDVMSSQVVQPGDGWPLSDR